MIAACALEVQESREKVGLNVERHDTTHHSADFGIKERCDQLLDQSAAGDVVGIEDEDHFGLDQGHRILERRCFASLPSFAMERLYAPRVGFDKLVNDLAGTVGRTIVDGYHSEFVFG